MSLARLAISGAAVALLAAGCSAAAPPAPPPPPEPAPAPPVTFSVPPPVTVTPVAPTVVIATSGPRQWTMPDLVGSNLQDAQNAIQKLTGNELVITFSHDVSGKGREQLLDRNWKVCSQNVPPGEKITSTTRIDFGAVRIEERC